MLTLEPFIADLISNKKMPKIIRYIIVILLSFLMIFLGIMMVLKSQMLLGKVFGMMLALVFLNFGLYLIIKIGKEK